MDAEPSSWSDVSLKDLFFAFRKAKADCYFETSVRVAEEFVLFEQRLPENLITLLEQLHAGGVSDVLLTGTRDPAIFPKRVGLEVDASPSSTHAFFSDAERSFRREAKRGLTPEFRMIGVFSVEVHILSALWVNLIGHKFDAQLSRSAVASRLRRYRRDSSGATVGNYHLQAIGSFEPYYEPYRRWRDSGLDAIRMNLEKDRGVVALTLDVSNFYHNIDPRFAVNPSFHKYAGIDLTDFEVAFTQYFVDALIYWADRCTLKIQQWGCKSPMFGGLPIGLSIVRVLSNVTLLFLDREVENSVSPIYYARYVDDIFLVLADNDTFESQDDVWEMLQSRVPSIRRMAGSSGIELDLPDWGGKTRIVFQPEKQKCFFLSGESGTDLLRSIAAQIREVSSERRLMLLPEQLDQTQSARALTATYSADEADNLRRADGLTLRRLGWSVLLSSVEVLSKDLHAKDWAKERLRFYGFAHDHVIRPDKILEQIDRIPRLFSIAVSLSDWIPALRILRETIAAIFSLQRATIGRPMKVNGHVCQSALDEVWDEARAQVRRFFREALVRSASIERPEQKAKALFSLLEDLELTVAEYDQLTLAAREADWARLPYKEHLRLHAARHAPTRLGEEALHGRYEHEPQLRRFLERSVAGRETQPCGRVRGELCGSPYDSLLPYLFPTRAYTPEEIALYLPAECVEAEPLAAAHSWADYTRAVRGIWVRSNLADATVPPPADGMHLDDANEYLPRSDSPGSSPALPRRIVLDSGESRFPVRLGITSFETSDSTWALGASGHPDLSPARYKAIAGIVNHALKEEKTPHYLIMPELSVPEQWIRTISRSLRERRISLIAGLDYRRYQGGTIDSSAVLILDDNRLGYSTSLQIRQRKSQPAPDEEKNLLRSHGQLWNTPRTELKPVYVHRGFHFSVLVCSELQNIAYRAHLQGQVDALLVVSWNKDVETFSALVDSASLDVHAYVALSNNLRYGDSRVRSPAKESFRRDVCRVRGGVNNQLVVVNIDPQALRAQQSRAKRWPDSSDAYKPAPEGFIMPSDRSTTPN
jgi:hypothetical protein